MPAPHDQPRWPDTIPWSRHGPAPGRWRSRADATSWVDALARPLEGIPLWADRRRLAVLILGRPQHEDRLTGGAMAATSRLTYSDGSQAVRKTFTDDAAGKRKASAEYLASLVAEAVGASAPAVFKDPTDPEHSVIMGLVSGDPGTVHTGSASAEEWGQALYYYAETDGGRRIGLLDLLIDNSDRHADNWMLSDEYRDPHPWRANDPGLRRAIAIDHSETFPHQRMVDSIGARVRRRDDDTGTPVTAPWEIGAYLGFGQAWLDRGRMSTVLGEDPGFDSYIFAWKDRNPLHPDDVPVLRGRLEALRPRFVDEDRLDAYVQMMRRFEAIAQRAGGTERMFP